MRRGNPFFVLSRLRAIDERQARAELANARQAHDRARQRLEAYKEQYRRRRTPEEILAPIELRSLQLRGLHGHETLAEAAGAYDEARRHLDGRISNWRRAAGELDAVERLKNRRLEEAARYARKVSERALDDLLVMLHDRDEAAS